MAARKKKRTAYHHGDLRRALLDEAKRTIAADGIDAVKTNRLAKALGVSSAAPFRHFKSREELLVALAEEGAQKMVAAMDDAAAQHAEPLDAHRARGIAYVRFAVDEPAYFRLLSRRDVVSASPAIQAASQANLSLMEGVLGRDHEGGRTPELVRRSAGVLAAQALTYGLARMIDDGLLGDDIDGGIAETLAYELTGVLGDGLAR